MSKKKKKPKDRLGQVKGILDKINPIKQVTEAILKVKANHFATRAAAFAHKDPDTLTILLDPKTDVFFMSYDRFHVPLLMRSEGKRKMNIVKGAMLFNKETMEHADEANYLLGTMMSGLNSLRALREKRLEKESRKYKRIIMTHPKYKEKEKLERKERKEQEKIEKHKKMKARIAQEAEQQQIAKEQEEINKPKDNN